MMRGNPHARVFDFEAECANGLPRCVGVFGVAARDAERDAPLLGKFDGVP